MTAAVVARPASTRRVRRVRRVHLITLLRIDIWATIIIPAKLHIGPLGSFGSPSLLLGLLLLGMWAVWVLSTDLELAGRVPPVRVALLALWVSTLLSYAAMNFHPVAVDELANSDRLLLQFAAFSGLALAAAEGIRTVEELLTVLRTFIAAVASMCAIAVLQFAGIVDLTQYIARIPILTADAALQSVFDRNGFNRPAGTATHPIEFGVVVGVGLGFVLASTFAALGWTGWRRWVPMALIAAGIPVAVSRSALLVGGLALITFWLGIEPRIRPKILAGLGFFGVCIFMSVPGLLGTLRSSIFAGESDSSISSRTEDYAAVSPLLRHSPWIGRGPGTYLPRIRILDNQYLLTLVESGLIGMLAMMMLFGASIVLARGGRRRWRDVREMRMVGQAFVGCGWGIFFASATFDAFSFPMFTVVIALILGLAGAYWRLGREHVAAISGPASSPRTP